jgi:MFS family permease
MNGQFLPRTSCFSALVADLCRVLSFQHFPPASHRLSSRLIAASLPGLLLFGYISDHFPLRLVITISCMGSAFSCLLVWGFASSSAPVLITFVLLFGVGLSPLSSVIILACRLPHGDIPPSSLPVARSFLLGSLVEAHQHHRP